MSKSNIALLTLSVLASAAVTNGRAITQAGAHAAAGGLAIGITRSDGTSGDMVPVDVMGTAIAEAGAAFDKDVALMVGTNGKLIAHDGDGDKHAVARSIDAATADGSRVEVLLVPTTGLLVTAA
jgi:hypothetical protein